MAKVEMVNFASPTSGSENVALSKITGTPKAAVFMMGSGLTAPSSAADVRLGFGFTDGTTNRGIGVYDKDTTSPTDTSRRHAAEACVYAVTTGVIEEFSCAFSAGDLDLTYSTTWGGAALYSALAFDCEAAAVVDQTIPTSTGEFDITSMGALFDSFIFLTITNTNSVPNTGTVAKYSIGFANRRGQQVCLAGAARDNVATTDTRASLWDNRCAVLYNNTPSSGSIDELSFVGANGDGCRLNLTKSSGNASHLFVLGLKGIDIGIRTFAQPTSTGTQNVTGARPRPQAGVVLGSGDSRINNATAKELFGSVGFFDSDNVNRSANFRSDSGGSASSDPRSRHWHDDEVVTSLAWGGTRGEANTTAMLSDGVKLNWGIASQPFYHALITFGNIESGRRSMTSTRGDCWRCRDLNRLKV